MRRIRKWRRARLVEVVSFEKQIVRNAMRIRCLGLGLALAFAASMLSTAPAAAGQCCGHAPYPYVGPVVAEPVVPVSHYWFAPPDQVSQIYVVNQGPVYSGAGIYAHNNIYVPSLARPAAWARDYLDVHPYWSTITIYPYVRHYGWRHAPVWYRYAHRVRHPARVAPMIDSPSGGY
jgi:hypothetical protein